MKQLTCQLASGGKRAMSGGFGRNEPPNGDNAGDENCQDVTVLG
jgi:hypothetical protein